MRDYYNVSNFSRKKKVFTEIRDFLVTISRRGGQKTARVTCLYEMIFV